MLTLDCQGAGAPTVITEGATGEPLDAMAQVQARLATKTNAYRRVSVTEVCTLGDANRDLRELVADAILTSPFVIVGQPIGGDLAQQYVRIFPDDVVEVVSMSPGSSGPACAPGPTRSTVVRVASRAAALSVDSVSSDALTGLGALGRSSQILDVRLDRRA